MKTALAGGNEDPGTRCNKVEIFTDFRGYYYISKIYEGTDPRYSNYELFIAEYENLWSQEVLIGLPELKPNKRYELRFSVVTDWDWEHTDCSVEVHYSKNSLKELK